MSVTIVQILLQHIPNILIDVESVVVDHLFLHEVFHNVSLMNPGIVTL